MAKKDFAELPYLTKKNNTGWPDSDFLSGHIITTEQEEVRELENILSDKEIIMIKVYAKMHAESGQNYIDWESLY